MSSALSQRHIVIVNNTSIYIHRFRREFIRSLIEKGFRVTLICPRDAATPKIEDLGATLLEFQLQQHGTNLLAELKAFWQLFRVLRRLRPDIVANFTIKPAIYGSLAARAAGVPAISSVFTGLGYYFTEDNVQRGRAARIIRFLLRLALPSNRSVIFQNGDDRDLLRRYGLVQPTQVRIVPGSGVNLSNFQRQPVPSGPEVFLLVGRMLPEKGVREFVAAAAATRAKHPHVRFQLLGGIDTSGSAIPLAEIQSWTAAGSVEYLGEVDDVRPYVAAASVVVLPSYREGLPRSVLEAMAIGRAIVASDVPGCRETVVNGVNGYLVEVRSAEALAAAFEQLIGQPEKIERMGAESHRLVHEKFEVHAINTQLRAAIGADSSQER